MSAFTRDLRHSLRLLFKTPGFSLTAVLVLALGIGANAAVFSLVNGLLFKPLAGADRPGTPVGVYSHDKTKPDSYRGFSYPAYTDVRDRATSFSSVTAFTLAMAGIGEADATRRTLIGVVSRNYFATLGVDLLAGRTFTAEEERPDSLAAVAVVSYPYWKRSGSDPALLGKTIRLNTRPFTVIGISPRGFTGSSVIVAPDAWIPLGSHDMLANDFERGDNRAPLGDRRNQSLMVIGRLKPEVTVEAAAAPLAGLSTQLEREFPAENKNQLLTAHPLARGSISTSPQRDGDLFAPLAILTAMAAVVLLIASLNLANMMLARGTARRKEIAMRLALGGSRARIVRQLVTEGFLLSVAGGAAGLLAGYWSVALLVSSVLSYSPLPITLDASPDIRVALATLAFCAAATVVFGLGPAWRLSRTSIVPQLKEQAGEDSGKGRWFGARNLLVGAQVALSLALLTAAGLFVRGAFNAGHADPGYRYDQQLLVSLDTSLGGHTDAQGRQVYGRLMERIRAVPGVASASLASTVAFGGFTEGATIQRVGGTGVNERPAPHHSVRYSIGSGYFRTLGLPVLSGRDFTDAEERDESAPRVAIIDEQLAKAMFPGENPVGQQIRYTPRDESRPTEGTGMVASAQPEAVEAMEIVGLVPSLRHDLFDRAPVAHLYVPFGRNFRNGMHVHVRTASADSEAEAAVLQRLRHEVRAVDDHLPVLALQSMEQFRDTSLLTWIVRAGAWVFSALGVVAVVLALVGLYAVKAYLVARRTREIGIRMALGATRGGVVTLVLKEGLALTAAGLVTGLLLAAGVGQVIGSMLYEVNRFDPIVFVAAPVILSAAAFAACYVPARRATRVEPITALRTE